VRTIASITPPDAPKICGITNLEDAVMAVEEGADSLGFIFHQGSPRFITPEAASQIIEQLPPFVEKVGIITGGDAKFINKVIAVSGISLAQMHFQATDMLYGSLIGPHLRVVTAQRAEDVDYLSDRYRMIDTFSINGNKELLDLSWFEGKACSKIIFTGGVTLENIEQILPYGFYGVDISSEVENDVGKKDREKVRAFIRKAKQF
jgi:phosphoribosylanthranilate isomerase